MKNMTAPQDIYYIGYLSMHWTQDNWIRIQKNNPDFDKAYYNGQSKTAYTHEEALRLAKYIQKLQGGNDYNMPIDDHSDD